MRLIYLSYCFEFGITSHDQNIVLNIILSLYCFLYMPSVINLFEILNKTASGLNKSHKFWRYQRLLCLNILNWKRICIVRIHFICTWCVNCFVLYDNDEVWQYAETISKFGSGMFLLVQVMLLLDFVHGWNDKWVGFDEQFWLVLGFDFFVILVMSFSLFDKLSLYFWMSFSVFTCVFIQVRCSICCFTSLLCGNICIFGCSLSPLHTIWTRLWPQRLFHYHDPDSRICFCHSGFASCSKFIFFFFYFILVNY